MGGNFTPVEMERPWGKDLRVASRRNRMMPIVAMNLEQTLPQNLQMESSPVDPMKSAWGFEQRASPSGFLTYRNGRS